MKGAIYDGNGRLSGSFIAASDEARLRRLVPDGMNVVIYEGDDPHPLRHRVVDGALVDAGEPTAAELLLWQWGGSPPLDIARSMAVARIDAAAGRARARYITTAPGQEATYQTKYAEALAYRANGYPADLAGYPYVAGESEPNAPRTATEAADRIIRTGDLWANVIGPQIESTRVNGKDRLGALVDAADIAQLAEEVTAALDAI